MYGQCVPLKPFTSFNIGGNAAELLIVDNIDALVKSYTKKSIILGKGSNVLISDSGYNGLVIINRICKIEKSGDVKGNTSGDVNGDTLKVYSGTPLPQLCSYCLKHSLQGFEWAVGIPASVGGALIMNAGAFNHTISESLIECEVLRDGNIFSIAKDDLNFSYRKSSFKAHDVIVSATFEFKKGESGLIKQAYIQNLQKRKDTQPKGFSAGSIFLNADKSAGYYIESAGLKGFSIGQAQISPKHANFIINCGFASSADVADLIKTVKATVYDKFDVMLKEEIKYIGEF